MIGIDGQYIVQFTIGDEKDFISELDLIKFKIIEYAGGRIPEFELNFSTPHEKLLTYFNEGNKFQVSIGATLDSLMDIELITQKVKTIRVGATDRIIQVKGSLNALAYQLVNKIKIVSETSAVEAIKKVSQESGFFPVSNVEKSADKQNWIQHNIPDKSFIHNIYLHADMPDSFIMVAVNSDNEFVIRDLKTLLGEDIKWSFTDHQALPTDIVYTPDFSTSSHSGFINAWFGYNPTTNLIDVEKSEMEGIQEKVSPSMSLSKKLNQDASVASKFSNFQIKSRNTHARYWESYKRNLNSLALFSQTRVELSFTQLYKPVKVLDLVTFRESELTATAASEYYSGKYIVARVARVLEKKSFRTNVMLCREGTNRNRGDFL